MGDKRNNLFNGIWPEAIKQAGYEPTKRGRRKKSTTPKKWNEESVIKYIKEHYAEVGSSSVGDWRESDYSAVVSAVWYNNLFNRSWPEAIKQAGYEPTKRGRKNKNSLEVRKSL